MKPEILATYLGTNKGCAAYSIEAQMNRNAFDKLRSFLTDLAHREIRFTLSHNRDEANTVSVAVPGERWEIEFLDDGSIEVERFISNGEVHGEEILKELFARYADAEDRRTKLERFEELLAKVPDVEPEEYDKL